MADAREHYAENQVDFTAESRLVVHASYVSGPNEELDALAHQLELATTSPALLDESKLEIIRGLPLERTLSSLARVQSPRLILYSGQVASVAAGRANPTYIIGLHLGATHCDDGQARIQFTAYNAWTRTNPPRAEAARPALTGHPLRIESSCTEDLTLPVGYAVARRIDRGSEPAMLVIVHLVRVLAPGEASEEFPDF